MYKGINRINTLNPARLLDGIDVETTDELLIRRSISTMYMSLFNFWAAIEYYQNNQIGNGKGKAFTNDDFTMTRFEKSFIGTGSKYIFTLSNYRNACDHRLENPARVTSYNTESIGSERVPINNKSLRKAHESFIHILEVLKNKVDEGI